LPYLLYYFSQILCLTAHPFYVNKLFLNIFQDVQRLYETRV